MKNYRIYINQQGLQFFTKVNTGKEAGFILERFDSREVHTLIIEHDTELDCDNPCTNEIRKKYIKKVRNYEDN